MKLQALEKDWFQMLCWDAGSSFCLPAGSRVKTRTGGREPGLSLVSELPLGHHFFSTPSINVSNPHHGL